MKKITALVLSLVMVLGLATTAFGTTATVVNSPLNAPAGVTLEKLPDGTLIYYGTAEEETPAADTEVSADTTVESAQTFDAGVVTFVAMSLAATAGSAVVLKKKD